MKKIVIFLSVIFLFSNYSFSSSIPAWAKVGGRNGNDVFTSIVCNNDGSYLFGGYTTSRGDDEDTYIVKLDRSGALVSEYVYNLGGDDRITSLSKLPDGRVYACGYLNYGGSRWGFVMKLKPNLAVSFINKFSFGENTIAKSIKLDGSTPYIVGTSGNNSFLAKGDNIISYTIVENILLYDFVIDANGFVCVGASDNKPIVAFFDTSLNYKESFLLYGSNTVTEGRCSSIIKLPSSYIIGGEFDFSSGASIFLAKIDLNNQILWVNKLDKRDGAILKGATLTKGGDILCWGTFIPSSGVPLDGWASLWGVDSSLIWQRRYGGELGDEIWAGGSPSDGGFILAGKTKSYGKGGENFFIVRSDDFGYVDDSCDFIKDSNLGVEILNGAKLSITLNVVSETLSLSPVSEIKKDPLNDLELLCYSGPVIFQVQKLSEPFRLVLLGGNFRDGLSVYIGNSPTPWPKVAYKSGTKVVLKRGNSLKSLFPKGVPVLIRLYNPDGRGAEITYTRE